MGIARLAVRVQPNAGRSQFVRFEDGVLHLKIAAPPAKGKANRELIVFLSKLLDISRSSLSIEKGHTNRHKTLAVSGITPQALAERTGKLQRTIDIRPQES